MSGISQLDNATAGEEVPIAGIAGWHNAVKHIDTAPDAFEQVSRCAYPHQIARRLGRQFTREVIQHAQHLGLWFTNR